MTKFHTTSQTLSSAQMTYGHPLSLSLNVLPTLQMRAMDELEVLLSLLAEAPLGELQAMDYKYTTSHDVALSILKPLDRRWLEATQLSLPLEDALQTCLKECYGQLWYPLWERPLS